jgi:hypothetical protein
VLVGLPATPVELSLDPVPVDVLSVLGVVSEPVLEVSVSVGAEVPPSGGSSLPSPIAPPPVVGTELDTLDVSCFTRSPGVPNRAGRSAACLCERDRVAAAGAAGVAVVYV